jgi:DNA repair exonuclease SbcCD nuclease subunit
MLNKIKILHCADLHLGSELTAVPGRARERRQELLKTFRKITNICQDENIDLLLIAGDLFEGANIDGSTIQSVKEYLGSLDKTIAAIAPGNHDYASVDSPYADEDWPDNVVVFRAGLEAREFPEHGFTIWGAAFAGTYCREPLLVATQAVDRDPNQVHVCVLHGDLTSEGADSVYNPVSESQLADSGFDYVALGHIHKRTPILFARNTAYAYSGCPDGRGFDELGEKGVYIGTVARGHVDLEFRQTCSRMYLTTEIDISGAASETEILDQVLHSIADNYGSDYRDNYYKIILTGSIPAGYRVPVSQLTDSLLERLHFVKIKNRTRAELDYDQLAQEASLRGIYVRRMLERIETAEARKDENEVSRIRAALEIGMRAFEGEVQLSDY